MQTVRKCKGELKTSACMRVSAPPLQVGAAVPTCWKLPMLMWLQSIRAYSHAITVPSGANNTGILRHTQEVSLLNGFGLRCQRGTQLEGGRTNTTLKSAYLTSVGKPQPCLLVAVAPCLCACSREHMACVRFANESRGRKTFMDVSSDKTMATFVQAQGSQQTQQLCPSWLREQSVGVGRQ